MILVNFSYAQIVCYTYVPGLSQFWHQGEFLSWWYVNMGKTTIDILIENNFSYNELLNESQQKKFLTKQEDTKQQALTELKLEGSCLKEWNGD